MMNIHHRLALAKDAIITVGDGRGFLMQTKNPLWSPVVITAAHCLPHFPPAHPASYTHERTYPDLLGPLGTPPTAWAECIFADPIADVAVLVEPDGQVLDEEIAEGYEHLMEGRPTLRLAAITRRSSAWTLTLDGIWQESTVHVGREGRALTLIDAHTAGGMSGSPILNRNGCVVGILSLGSLSSGVENREQSGQPALVSNLPSWLLAELLKSLEELPTVIAAQKRAWEQYLRRTFVQAKKARLYAAATDEPMKGGA